VTGVTDRPFHRNLNSLQTKSGAGRHSEPCIQSLCLGGFVAAFTPPPLPSDDKRWKIVNGTMRKNGFARHALIETLHTVQSAFGYLDDDSIRFVARSLRVPLSQAYGVVTFYHYFSLKPPGKHTITVCAARPAISRAPTSSSRRPRNASASLKDRRPATARSA
jgi:hypothetical protein